MTVKEQLVKS